MDYPGLAHCSDECLFDEIKNVESINHELPIDDWNSNPWI